MHAIKGGWVGQTFALAKGNENEGRKSRVRRSKEERKTMVESFIKKYQSSNNGNFPSLNLTHKEVGGSFYTVREIVREIIQENRVLGPAQFSPDELSTNQFDEQYPLGSISKEPQAPLIITSKGSHFIPNLDQGASKDPVAISDGLCSEHEKQRFENEGFINGSQVVMEIEESAKRTSEEFQTSDGSHFIPNHDQGVSKESVAISDGLCSEHEKQRFNNENQVVMEVEESARTYEELQTSKPSEAEERVEKLAASRATVTPISAEVVVETFPLRSVPKSAESSGERSEVENLTETLEENEIEKLNLDSGNGSAPLDQINSSERKGESPAGIVLDKNSDLVDKEVVENSADSQLKSSNFSTTGGTVPNTLVDKELEVEVSDSDVLTSGMHEKGQRIDDAEEINAANDKICSGTYSSSSRVESRTPKGIVFENKADVQCKESLPKGSNPKLDRIRIESWDGASRNSAARETNPILDAFKSFINAFIKFWSE